MWLLRHRSRTSELGFSLTEVLVAIAIFTLLGIAAIESIPAAHGLKKAIERQEEFLDLDFFLGEAALMGENSSFSKIRAGTLPLFYDSASSPSLLVLFSITPDSMEVDLPSLRNFTGFFYCPKPDGPSTGNNGAIVEAPSGRIVIGEEPGMSCFSLGASGFLPYVLLRQGKEGIEIQAGDLKKTLRNYDVQEFYFAFKDENGNEAAPDEAVEVSYEITLRHRRSNANKKFKGVIPLR